MVTDTVNLCMNGCMHDTHLFNYVFVFFMHRNQAQRTTKISFLLVPLFISQTYRKLILKSHTCTCTCMYIIASFVSAIIVSCVCLLHVRTCTILHVLLCPFLSSCLHVYVHMCSVFAYNYECELVHILLYMYVMFEETTWVCT